MIRLLPLFFALMLPLAQALTLDEALQAAPSRTGVVTARTELRNAVANLERVQGDPLAVRADKLSAQQRLALAKVNFTQSYYAALSEIESAYTGVLQARFGVQVAQKAASVSQKGFRDRPDTCEQRQRHAARLGRGTNQFERGPKRSALSPGRPQCGGQ